MLCLIQTTKYEQEGYIVKKILIILTICLITATTSLLLYLSSTGAPIYESGYIFYDYENDTDYIDQTAPFINAGGRIYYIFKEPYIGNGIVNYCNSVAYIEYKTGVAYTVCDDKKCVHNAVNFRRTCELVDFQSNMTIDEEGYIYGSYEKGAFEDRLYRRERTPEYNQPELARYNLYNRSFQKLYLYKTDENSRNTYSNGFVFVYPYKNCVYFYEYITDGDIFRTYLRRYSLADNSAVTLAEAPVPYSFNIFDRYIYISDANGLYCYDLDYSESSQVRMLDFSDAFFDGSYASNLQYDSFMKNIYFIKSVSSVIGSAAGTLYSIKSYDYDSEAGVVDRKIHPVAAEGDIYTYQLTYDRIYYIVGGQRFIGTYTTVEGESADYYDYTDGRLYSIPYSQSADRTGRQKVVYDFGDTLVRNMTVIGNYIYGELYGESKREAHAGYYRTSYEPVEQIRIDTVTGLTNILKPRFWNLRS